MMTHQLGPNMTTIFFCWEKILNISCKPILSCLFNVPQCKQNRLLNTKSNQIKSTILFLPVDMFLPDHGLLLSDNDVGSAETAAVRADEHAAGGHVRVNGDKLVNEPAAASGLENPDQL